jgi:hypothetical protein
VDLRKCLLCLLDTFSAAQPTLKVPYAPFVRVVCTGVAADTAITAGISFSCVKLVPRVERSDGGSAIARSLFVDSVVGQVCETIASIIQRVLIGTDARQTFVVHVDTERINPGY